MLVTEEKYPEVAQVWKATLNKATGLGSTVDVRPLEEIVTVQDVLDLLSGAYACILLPLVLPRYNSLRLAEYAHRLKSGTRVITVTGTEAPARLFTPLFDGFIATADFGVESL